MFGIFEGVRRLLKLESICIDNNIFRLHYKFTFIVLISFSLLITSKQFIGAPIVCITNRIELIETLNIYCWLSSTFAIPKKLQSNNIDYIAPGVGPYKNDTYEEKHQKYYQWVCFALFFQAILFYVPHFLWKTWEGGRIKILVNDLKFASMDQNLKQKRYKDLREYFLTNWKCHRLYFLRFFFCELLNFANVIGQMFFMDLFLDGEFTTYGTDVIQFSEEDPYKRTDPMSRVFPKITKCTMNMNGNSGSTQNVDGLCILPLNVANEKIYIFLWFWFILLSILTGLAVLYRFATLFSAHLRYVLMALKFRLVPKEDIWIVCKHFEVGDLFVLYQLSHNVDPLLFRELVMELSDCFNNHMGPTIL